MEYQTVRQKAEEWNMTIQMVRRYCKIGRIPDAVQRDGAWMIPANAESPGRPQKHQRKEVVTSIVKKVAYQKNKNNHFGLYEYLQVNAAYSSNRMASNRLTLEQVIDIYRTRKISIAFEPMKIDDLVEVVNHFIAMQYIVDNIMKPLSKDIIRRVHYLLVYGTYAERKHKTDAGEYRTEPHQYGISAKRIPTALEEIIVDYENCESIDIDRIMDFHVRFERIHPFSDYNGRVGRLLMIKECLRNNIEPFIIDDKHRGDYYRGLKRWEKNPDVLRNVCIRAQDRFRRQMEVCMLMQYYRPPNQQ